MLLHLREQATFIFVPTARTDGKCRSGAAAPLAGAALLNRKEVDAMTDMELLAMPKVGPEQAARYLQNGTSAQEIRVKAQNGICPFCKAEKGSGRYRYRVLVNALIKYKAGEM